MKNRKPRAINISPIVTSVESTLIYLSSWDGRREELEMFCVTKLSAYLHYNRLNEVKVNSEHSV
eukprot:scaffold7106_cov279-Amphora_coffeaeformis.AAC.3